MGVTELTPRREGPYQAHVYIELSVCISKDRGAHKFKISPVTCIREETELEGAGL